MTRAKQILFITALPFEGAAIRRYLDLVPGNGVLAAFDNPPYHLIVSGVGKAHAAAATGVLCSQYDAGEIGAVVNIGVAGAVSDATPLGSAWLIHHIRDAATTKSFYPDMLAAHQMNETCVTTYDKPVSATDDIPDAGLVDMEASAFFEAASMFTGPEKIICVKVVSDLLQSGPPRIDTKKMSAAIESAMPDIMAAVQNSCMCGERTPETALDKTHYKYIDGLTEVLQLTRTQQAQLKQAVIRFIHQHPDTLLPDFVPARFTTARERNHCFAQFQKQLLR